MLEENDIEKEFRKKVSNMKKQEKIAQETLNLLEHGFKFGKRLYKNRSELYER
ncbi:MAG: hypothetical protein ABOK23_02575 [Candidatus Methanoperedens sp.]|nr:hypothetical protein [Candidatus Methanoperedens sp.]MCZ7394728.1 hypothetical protein [Candidatus Methanoperedens sp.]